MFSDIPQTHQTYNPEINDAIEKLYLNININSKGQREKGILELHKTFLSLLSKHLEKTDKEEISDLILDKSLRLSEITQEYDWQTAESLKVPNLHRFANQLYVYVRMRLNLLSGKGKKSIKDGAIKGAESLLNILNSFVEEAINLENNLIFLCFEDLFSFFCMSGFNEKIKESIKDLISFAKEESNISELVKKNTNIEKSAEKNLFLGTLAVLLEFKIDLVTCNKEMDITVVENIFKHEVDLRKIHLLTDVNFVWVYLCHKFGEGKEDFEYCKICLELLQNCKIYKEFLVPNQSKFIDNVLGYEKKIRSLVIFNFVDNYINLTESFFLKMDYNQNQIDELKGLSIYNLFPIKKFLKSKNVEDYHLFKFDQKILEKLEKNATEKKDKDVIRQLNRQYNDLIIEKQFEIKEKDIKGNNLYLKERLIDKNKKYDDLLKNL